jgi:hypothetical protein
MRISGTIPSGDYQVVPFLKEYALEAGDFDLATILLALSGNVANCEFALYLAESGKAALTNAERAASEIFIDTAVVAAADPDPDLYVKAAEPIVIPSKSGESLYIYLSTGDAAVSGSFRLAIK